MRSEPVPDSVAKSPYKAPKKKRCRRKMSKEGKQARAEKEQVNRVLRTAAKRVSTLSGKEAIIKAVMVDAPVEEIEVSVPITPTSVLTVSEDNTADVITPTSGLTENEDAITTVDAFQGMDTGTPTQAPEWMLAKIRDLEMKNLDLHHEKEMTEARCNERLREQDKAHTLEINQLEQYYHTKLHAQSVAHEQEMRQLDQGMFPEDEMDASIPDA